MDSPLLLGYTPEPNIPHGVSAGNPHDLTRGPGTATAFRSAGPAAYRGPDSDHRGRGDTGPAISQDQRWALAAPLLHDTALDPTDRVAERPPRPAGSVA